MGWGGGSNIASDMMYNLQKELSDEEDIRQTVYFHLICALEDQDWDTIDDVMGQDPAFDRAVCQMYPERKNENLRN